MERMAGGGRSPEFLEGLKTLIRKGATVDAIRTRAAEDGMRSLMQDGLAKVLQGKTTVTQVKAVCLR